MNDHITEEKLFDFFNGALSEAEEQAVREWAEAADENRQLFIKCQNEYLALQFGVQAAQIKLDYSSIEGRIRPKKRSRRKRIVAVASACAAVLAVGLFVATLVGQGSNDPDNFEGNTAPGTSRAILELADGTVVELGPDRSDVIEQNGSYINIGEGEISYVCDEEAQEIVFNSISTPRRGEHKLRLGDGTVIWLNSESSLRYPQVFAGGERRVFLRGEAYFDVAHNEEMPFVVETDEQVVTVLGTEFNIYAYPEGDRIFSTLVSGSVRINIRSTDEDVTLLPGQQAILDTGTARMDIATVDASEISAWKDGYFSLEKMTLEEVVHKLSRWYDAEFRFEDEAARTLTYKGSLARHTDLIKVLKLIQTISPVEFNYQKNVIEIRMRE